MSVACTDSERRMHECCGAIARGSGAKRTFAATNARAWSPSFCASAHSRALPRSPHQSSAGWLCSAELRLTNHAKWPCRFRWGRMKTPSRMTNPSRVWQRRGWQTPTASGDALSNLAAAAHNAARDESKTRFLLRLLARLRRRGVGSALIFTEYRDTLARLVERLTIAGYGVAMLHGGLTASERGTVQRQFNDRGGILLATDAAAEGLNLHHCCRLVIHYELPWNPARLEQRCGRVDRLGQTARVHELALVADHTAERLVVSPLLARLRSAGPRQKAMLDALSESRVAAAVMNSADVDAEDDEAAPLPSTVVQAPGELALLAAREVSRLEEARILIGRSQRASRQAPRLAISTHPRIQGPRAWALRLSGARDSRFGWIGSSQRSDGGAYRLRSRREAPRCIPHRDTTSRNSVGPDHPNGIHRLACRVQSEARTAAGLPNFDALRRRRQRERWHAIRDGIGGGQPAASRMLVQQGLFDRRSARAAAARAARQTRQLEAITEEDVAPEPSLSMRTEAIAALLVLDRA